MQTPNGYSWKSDPWVSTGALVSRMNFALVLASDRLPGVSTDWSKLVKGASPADSQVTAKERKLEAALLGFPLSEKTRTQVLALPTSMAVKKCSCGLDINGFPVLSKWLGWVSGGVLFVPPLARYSPAWARRGSLLGFAWAARVAPRELSSVLPRAFASATLSPNV